MSERHAATPEQGAVRPAPSTDMVYDAAWREKRSRFLRSRLVKDDSCAACGRRNGRMDVHHKSYRRANHERLMDLVLLCPDCHLHVHRMYAQAGSVQSLWSVTNRVVKMTRRHSGSPYNARPAQSSAVRMGDV